MLECFDGMTGLANVCGEPYAVSPVVPLESFGIDETMVGQFISSEDTISSFIRDAEARTRAIMQTDILTRFASRIIPRTFLHAQRVGEPDGHQTLVTGQSGLHGILVEVDQPASSTRLTLSGWRFYGAANSTIEIKVHDLSDGSEIDSFDIDAQANTVVGSSFSLTIQLPRRAGRFFIAHDQTTWRVQRIGSGCTGCRKGVYRYGGVFVTGANLPAATAMVRSNLRTSSMTGGLSVVVDYACDHAQYLCESRDMLAPLYATKVAELIKQRGIEAVTRMNSQRINLDLLRESAERLAKEYATGMDNLVGGAVLPGDDVCFQCVRYSRVRTTAP